MKICYKSEEDGKKDSNGMTREQKEDALVYGFFGAMIGAWIMTIAYPLLNAWF